MYHYIVIVTFSFCVKVFLLLQHPHLPLDPLVVLVQRLLLRLVRPERQAALLVVRDVQLLADVVHHLKLDNIG